MTSLQIWKLFITFAALYNQLKMDDRRLDVMFLEEAMEFVRSLPEKARKKITYNINRVRGGEIDREIFKKLDGTELWEFRTLFNGVHYRLLAFWDIRHKALIIATHGFTKKTQKTPSKEIAKAEAVRKEYLGENQK